MGELRSTQIMAVSDLLVDSIRDVTHEGWAARRSWPYEASAMRWSPFPPRGGRGCGA